MSRIAALLVFICLSTGFAVQVRPNSIGLDEFNLWKYRIVVARYTADGRLDTEFGNDGVVITNLDSENEWATDVAVDENGKIMVVGTVSGGGKSFIVLLRYNSGGKLDRNFGDDGVVTTNIPDCDNETADALVIDGAGRITVVGRGGHEHPSFLVVRYNDDGTLKEDTFIYGHDEDGYRFIDFNSGVPEWAADVAMGPEGTIVVGGWAQVDDDDWRFALARLFPNGKLDTSFDGDGKEITNFGSTHKEFGHKLVVTDDNKIFLAGSGYSESESYNNYAKFCLAKYNWDGSLDNTWSSDGKSVPNINGLAETVAVSKKGLVYVGGAMGENFNSDPKRTIGYAYLDDGCASLNFCLIRYDSNGNRDMEFGGSGTAEYCIGEDREVHGVDLVIADRGRPIMAGHGGDAGSDITKFTLIRWKRDGTLDPDFGNQGSGVVCTTDPFPENSCEQVYAMTLDSKGRIIVVGRMATKR